MMEAGRTWLLSVLVTCVLCAAADGLMPSGGVRQVGRLVCGLVLLWAILSPAVRLGGVDAGQWLEDYLAGLELRESAETLALYPYPFRLAVEQRLTDTGFSTAVTVANPGEGPLPFCLGAHTGFRCPLEAGERFEDYELVFPERESCPTLLLRDGLLDRPAALPCLEDTDTLPLDYRWFDALDTLIFEGLRSRSVTLRSRKSGRGVRVSFDGFPMLAFWTMPGKKAPYLCIEPWHGCAAGTAEGPEFTDKAHCIVLAPGESRTLAYRADTL